MIFFVVGSGSLGHDLVFTVCQAAIGRQDPLHWSEIRKCGLKSGLMVLIPEK